VGFDEIGKSVELFAKIRGMNMLKRRIFMVIIFSLLSLSCFSGDDNPPFPRGVYLDYQGAKLIIGYTTISYVNDVLGEPEETKTSKYGGEDFFWENMLENTYFSGRLLLIFSMDKEVLIQIIFKPSKEDEYSSLLGINERSGREGILKAMQKSRYSFETVQNSSTIWLYYYKRDEPYLNVACGFQFNDSQSLYALNYHVDASW
jgi:hypothetical protein